jgi:sterol desaturase/sphingolipid hydroxylase (fatty acid hydroxylase superfamily)/predicted amino acid dehydrogenase
MDLIGTQLHNIVLDNKPTWISPDFATFSSTMVVLWITRVLILKSLVQLGRSQYAEQFRITKRPVINDAQLERESVWVYGYFYDFITLMFSYYFGLFRNMPLFISESIGWYFVFHATIVEFVYYWFHRLLHVSWVYKNFHQYHHKSINTEPTTGLSFEIAERLSYTALFSVAPLCVSLLGLQSYVTMFLYFIWFDVMNEGGHINFEVLPEWYHKSPLKYLFYSPTFHSVHHTKFKKNYSLFMPWSDILFGTAIYKDTTTKSEELLPTHVKTEKKSEFVLLVHGGHLASILYSNKLHPKLAELAKLKNKYEHKPWMYLLYPYLLLLSTYIGYFEKGVHSEEEFDFTVPSSESNENKSKSVRGATWIVRNLGAHYLFKSYKKTITNRIEDAVLEAQDQGVKVVGLGNFNKAEWINHGGLDIVEKLKNKLNGTYIAHGDTLSAASVYQYSMWLREQNYWNKAVFITGATSKIGRAVCLQLVKNDITVFMYSQCRARYQEIADEAAPEKRHLLVYCNNLADGKNCDLWLTGKMIPHGVELLNAIPKYATIVNFAVPDPLNPKLMATRPDLLHLDSGLLAYDSKVMCPRFTWLLPAGTIYACLAGCIVHSMLGIQAHEVGPVVIEDMDKYWKAAKECGFTIPPHSSFYSPTNLPAPRLSL